MLTPILLVLGADVLVYGLYQLWRFRRNHGTLDRASLTAFGRLSWPLVTLGFASEAVYLYLVRQFPLLTYYRQDIDMGGITGHTPAGFSAFVGAFTVLFLLFAGAWWALGDGDDGGRRAVVFGFGALFALTMIFVYPVTAIDLFTYVAQGVIMTQYHQNPIFTAPSAFPADPIMALADGWRQYGAPYGPLGIAVDALPSLLVGANLLANLLLLKLMFCALSLLTAFCVYLVVRKTAPAWALRGALLVAWNPLILFEIGANGHNDVVMMVLVVLALLALSRERLLLGLLLVVASALVKYATGLLIPLVLIYGLTRQATWQRAIAFGAQAMLASLALAAAAYGPFWRGLQTFSRSLLENQMHIESFSNVASQLLPWNLSLDQATMLGRIVFIPLYLLTIWLATRRFSSLVQAGYLAMFFFLVVGAGNFKIWYATWPAVLAAAMPAQSTRLSAVLLAYGATISAAFYGYLWPLLGLFKPGTLEFVNDLAYAVSFAPALLVLLAAALRNLLAPPGLLARKRARTRAPLQNRAS